MNRKEEMKLLPCPFCGGEAVDRREVDGFPMIYCNGDNCFGPQTTASTFEDAIVQWNTRAALRASAAPEEGMNHRTTAEPDLGSGHRSAEDAARPAKFLAWARETFGPVALVRGERLLRFTEEAIELAHADGMRLETLHAVINRVYSRAPGTILREIGQAQACLETYAENLGESSDAQAEAEWQRVQAIPRTEWERRHTAKQKLGIALAASTVSDHQSDNSEPQEAVVPALPSDSGKAAPVDLTNHHNALKCPYCNPKGLTFAALPPATEDGGRETVIEECAQAAMSAVAMIPMGQVDASEFLDAIQDEIVATIRALKSSPSVGTGTVAVPSAQRNNGAE